MGNNGSKEILQNHLSDSETPVPMRGFRRLSKGFEKCFFEENSGKSHPLGGRKKGTSLQLCFKDSRESCTRECRGLGPHWRVRAG